MREIHVQQGRSMEEDGVTIGLVNATWAAHKYRVPRHRGAGSQRFDADE